MSKLHFCYMNCRSFIFEVEHRTDKRCNSRRCRNKIKSTQSCDPGQCLAPNYLIKTGILFIGFLIERTNYNTKPHSRYAKYIHHECQLLLLINGCPIIGQNDVHLQLGTHITNTFH